MNKEKFERRGKKVLLYILFWIVILLFLLVTYSIYEDKKYQEELERNMYIVELYGEIGKYRIWKRISPWVWLDPDEYYIGICDFEIRKCLEWRLKWIINTDKHIYGYIYNDYYFSKDYNKPNEWHYILMWKEYPDPKVFEDLKIFWIFTQEEVNFYSLNELKDLPEEQQEILLNLKERPRFLYK